MFSGKPPQKERGKREDFGKKSMPQSNKDRDMESAGEMRSMRQKSEPGGDGKTTITHNQDGSHDVQHADGEMTKHPSMGHMLMAMHAKHAGGEGHHVEVRPDGGSTTHHVDMAGMVNGPHDHQNMEALKQHLGKFFDEEGAEGSSSPIDAGGEHDENSLY